MLIPALTKLSIAFPKLAGYTNKPLLTSHEVEKRRTSNPIFMSAIAAVVAKTVNCQNTDLRISAKLPNSGSPDLIAQSPFMNCSIAFYEWLMNLSFLLGKA